MLIIFDLDDTLIDTSGAITPYQLRGALRELICCEPVSEKQPFFETLYEELLHCNATASSSKQAVIHFGRQLGCREESVAKAVQALQRALPAHISVPLTQGAQECMDQFVRMSYDLALVTSGDPSFQMEKLEKSGIDPSLFSNMVVPVGGTKGPSYQVLQTAFGVGPRDVWVFGDRPEVDLRPAYDLGFHTVFRRWGRGLRGVREPWIERECVDLFEAVQWVCEKGEVE